MPSLDRALTEVRASLTWTVEEIATDADMPAAWSNPETRTHVILAPKHPGSRLALLRELVHAALCEAMPRLYATGTVWGVSLGGQVVARKHYLRATRDWYAAARLRTLCPEAADDALAAAFAAARERLAIARPFVLDRLNLGPDERGRLADGILLAQVRRRLDRSGGAARHGPALSGPGPPGPRRASGHGAGGCGAAPSLRAHGPGTGAYALFPGKDGASP